MNTNRNSKEFGSWKQSLCSQIKHIANGHGGGGELLKEIVSLASRSSGLKLEPLRNYKSILKGITQQCFPVSTSQCTSTYQIVSKNVHLESGIRE